MKRSIIWLFILAILVLAAVFFPMLASTPIGKPMITQAIKAKLGGKVDIEEIRLSWFGPQRFFGISFSNDEVAGQIDSVESNVALWSLSNMSASFRLQNGAFSFPKYGGGSISKVNAKIEGSQIDATGSTPQGGSLSVHGKIYSKEDFDIALDLVSIPVGALDQILNAKGLVYQTLGPLLDLKGTVVYNQGAGAVHLDLSSTHAQTTLNAALSEHALTLNESLTASLRLTKELGEHLMSRINPLFLTGIEGKSPIILRVSSKNFSFPLPFTLDKLRIGSASLDMGQIQARIGPSLKSLLELLKSSRRGETISMWFTPVAFQIDSGVVSTGRMDALLAGSTHICSWGDIDLIRDQLSMYLGLPADTLAQAFGLQNLPRNYVLKIPVRGSTQDPDIDTSSASAKIASMVAAQQVPKLGGNSTGGKVFGGLLNLLTQPKEDEDVPPPNRPFPWEK